MKLIVTGATGFVGTEVIRLALSNPAITSVVALARRPVVPPTNILPGADISKLQSVVLEDWTAPYPESVKWHVNGADACIWCTNPLISHLPQSLTRPLKQDTGYHAIPVRKYGLRRR